MNSLFLIGLYEHHNHAFGHHAFPLCVKVENDFGTFGIWARER